MCASVRQVTLGVTLAGCLLFQAIATADQRDHLTLGQQVLRAAFPDLSGQVVVALETRIEDDWHVANPVRIVVSQMDHSAITHSRNILSAVVEIQRGGVIGAVHFFGEYVESSAKSLFSSARAMPGNLQSNATTVLQKSGARYVPDDSSALLTALNLTRFAAVLGNVRRTGAKFLPAPPVELMPDEEFAPIWIVTLETVSPAGVARCYSMTVDPLTLRPQRIDLDECMVK